MANVNFYLKTPNEKGNSLIYLFFSFDGKRLKYSTGEVIKSNFWNPDNQRVKKSYTGSMELNEYLDKIENDIKKIYRTLKTDNLNITSELLKEKLESESNKSQNSNKTFFQFAEEYIDSIVSLRKKGSIVAYRNALKTLLEFKSLTKRRIDFDNINLDFYNDYINFLIEEKKFKVNTIGKHIKTIKTFLNEATERGINKNLDFRNKRFKVLQEEIDSIYLNDDEINQIFQLDLSLKVSLEKVKDLFLIGCLTGLRFSDFSQLKPENITNDRIKIKTQKTNQTVIIPVHPIVNKILKRYNNNLPEAFSNQKMNKYLKELGIKAELNDLIERTEFVNGKRNVTFIKKYELITTHTARRSFATNLFKQGFPSLSIMKITGHKTETAFIKYVKVTTEQSADLLAKFWSKTIK